jgi:mercuric reductase
MTTPPRRATLEVAGMTCTDCEHHVTAALERAGAGQVSADFLAGVARFALPEGVGETGLRAAVTAAGYTPGRLRAASPGTAAAGAGDTGYDLLVLGAGSAAFAAAIRGRDAGYRVALAEAGTLGGTCVNVGCVPSKALLAAGAAYWAAGHRPFAGITTSAGPVDLAALVAQKDDLVAALRQQKYADLAGAYGFDVIGGHAAFTGPDTVEVAGRVIRPGAVLIATGASPAVPPIPGLAGAGYLTSTTALDLKTVPERLAVIGANAVGLELGQFFGHLGAAVTFLDVAGRIAPSEEPEVSQALTDVLHGQGATIHVGAQARAVERDGHLRRVHATVDGTETVIDADEVLVATGRRPATAGLGLQAAGVATDARGAVVADDRLRTTNPRVWAAGDVTGAPQFVYVAAYQGALAAGNALLGEDRPADLAGLPRVIFTSPPRGRGRAHRGPGPRGRLPGHHLGAARHGGAAGPGQPRHSRGDQAGRRRHHRRTARRLGGRGGGRRRHPVRGAGHPPPDHRRRAGRHLPPLPDHGRIPQARRPGLHPRRGPPLLLRRLRWGWHESRRRASGSLHRRPGRHPRCMGCALTGWRRGQAGRLAARRRRRAAAGAGRAVAAAGPAGLLRRAAADRGPGRGRGARLGRARPGGRGAGGGHGPGHPPQAPQQGLLPARHDGPGARGRDGGCPAVGVAMTTTNPGRTRRPLRAPARPVICRTPVPQPCPADGPGSFQ